jgi:hypothetical protein
MISARFCLVFGLCALVAGLIAGWTLRVNHSSDRYIHSLAARHEATASYYNLKTDQMISENERNFKNGK